MEWIVGALILALVTGVIVRRLPRDAAPGIGTGKDVGIDAQLFGDDSTDLIARFERVAAEAAPDRRHLITQRLSSLRSHRVPLRVIQAAPGPGVARLHFADGTVLLARSAKPGALSTLAVLRERGAVLVEQFTDHPDGVEFRLATHGSTRCTLIAVGLDQVD
jgi:hypothetical protein